LLTIESYISNCVLKKKRKRKSKKKIIKIKIINMNHGETKTTSTSSRHPTSTSSHHTPPSTFQRTWLSDLHAGPPTEKLGEQLEQAAYSWFDKQKRQRQSKNLKSHTALRYISNFEFLQRNTRRCEIIFTIGKSGDRFTLKYKPLWERGEKGQFFILTKAKILRNWADDLNTYNASIEGGEFPYAFQALEALLMQAERSYMDLIDTLQNNDGSMSPTSYLRERKKSSSGSGATTNQNQSISSGSSLRQPTSDQFKQVWNAHDADTSHASEAKVRILKEYQKMNDDDIINHHGITVELNNNNPFLWKVYLRNFQGPLGDDLKSRFQIYGSDAIELEIKFPAQYPLDPPFLRIKKPILHEFTGRVSGGTLCYPTLMKAGWDSSNRMSRVLISIKEHLETYDARVIIAALPACEYPLPTCKASWGYINDRVDSSQLLNTSRSSNSNGSSSSSINFSKDLIILSSSFVRECILPDSGNRELAGALNEQFEAGNKVLVHHKFFNSLQGHEMGSGGLTFQIITSMGLKCYCGILTGLCPEENQLIVPNWMMKSMFIDDGHKINFSTITTLNRLISVTLKPIDSNFNSVLQDTGYDSKTWLQNSLQNYSALTRGQTITLGCKNFDFHEKPHKFTKYNFILQSIEPDEQGVKLWNDFDFSMNLNFDIPLVDTIGLPSEQHQGETKSNNTASTSNATPTVVKTAQEVEEQFRRDSEMKRLHELNEKEKMKNMNISSNYNDKDDIGKKIIIWIHPLISGGKKRIQIKCKTTSFVSELYEILDQNILSSSSSAKAIPAPPLSYHLVDRTERRIPRSQDELNKSNKTTFHDLQMTKKNIKLWMKAPQASECNIVLALASKIYKRHKDDIYQLDASNETDVRGFLTNLPILTAMKTSSMSITSMAMTTDENKNADEYDVTTETKGETKGETKTNSLQPNTSTNSTINTSVSELIEHLIPYIQKAANVNVGWAPPGGWICNECDYVNLRTGTFGLEQCKRCSRNRKYMQEDISERDIWELSDFIKNRGIRAPNDFPTSNDYVQLICNKCQDIIEDDETDALLNSTMVMSEKIGEVKERSEEHRISTVVLPNGKAIGMCQPVVRLSHWYFTMKELAGSNAKELQQIEIIHLVDNLGANIL
jgi:ubiquitin-conjugating enzyme E2 Q